MTNETYTASQGLIDWATVLFARTDQGSLNWRVETSMLLCALAAAPESESMSAACEVHNYAATIIGSQKDEITDLKKQLAEAITRAEKAKAADGNAGLRELRDTVSDMWFEELQRKRAYVVGCENRRVHQGCADVLQLVCFEIDRILEAAPQPERDDGPLIAFSVDDCGHRYDDALADAVSELCRREIARGQR